MDDFTYLEKVYAGIIGKTAGVRLGAPVEPTIWSYERIYNYYGNISNYLREYKNFAADDDLNGPLFFIRALSDYCKEPSKKLDAMMVGNAWLNYTREEKGMFWWGGYGRSAEHTAYIHLKNNIAPPVSGSINLSGPVIPQQIGGQIFIDTWGLISPDNPEQAAELAGTAASVSHDGVGIEGARFVAAAIATAFSESDAEIIVRKAIAVLDKNSELLRIILEIIKFHSEQPSDFRACRDFLDRSYGYWKYPGVCPLPSNAGVIVLSLLYGNGDFGRTIEIATMCGWDTDCNAGNAGTIAGVAYGLSGIPERYRKPINDSIVASSISGSLNIIDIPSISAYIASCRYLIEHRETPEAIQALMPNRDLRFQFLLDGSTHGFRVSDTMHFQLRHTRELSPEKNSGALKILVDRLERGQIGRVFYKPYYRRYDFDDERYDPAFSPLIYSGQKFTCSISVSIMSGETISVAPYVAAREKVYEGVFIEMGNEDQSQWKELTFTIPDTQGIPVDEVGILIMNYRKGKFLGSVNMRDIAVSGLGRIEVDFKNEVIEFGTITQCTTNGGAWSLEGSHVRACSTGPAALYTGNYYSKDYLVTGRVLPVYGESHLLVFRSLGAMMDYSFGFTEHGKIALLKNDHGIEVLSECAFKWNSGTEYSVTVKVSGCEIICMIDGATVITYCDETAPFLHGMVGYRHLVAGNTLFGALKIEEI